MERLLAEPVLKLTIFWELLQATKAKHSAPT